MLKHKSFTLKELAKVTDSFVIGDEDAVVDNLATIENASETSITFLSKLKYLSALKTSKACAVIVSKNFDVDERFNYLKTEDPYLAYAKISSLFEEESDIKIPHIHKSSFVSEKSIVHNDVYIGPNVYIGRNCEIGPNVIIHSNCSLVKNVNIISDTVIQNGAVLGLSLIHI